LPLDGYRLVRGLTTVPSEVDEGRLILFEGRPTPTLPLRRLFYNRLEAIFVLYGGFAYYLSSVVIDKGDRLTVLIDSLLYEVCVEEKKQDR
jgi:hypothetical protein